MIKPFKKFEPDKKQKIRQTIAQLKLLAYQLLKHLPQDKREDEENKLIKDKLINGKILSPLILREVLKKEKESDINCKEESIL